MIKNVKMKSVSSTLLRNAHKNPFELNFVERTKKNEFKINSNIPSGLFSSLEQLHTLYTNTESPHTHTCLYKHNVNIK